MRTIAAQEIENAVAELYASANIRLPESVRAALARAEAAEPDESARAFLAVLRENAGLAARENLPVCQDTGYPCVFLDIGREVYLDGNVNAAVNAGVRRATESAYLRRSVVADPVRRGGADGNTPAALYIEFTDGDRVSVTVAPKGFGSENKSRIAMLNPTAGRDGVIDFAVETVRIAGGSPCPPLVLGIGLGGTFDKAAYLAKRALLRECGEANADPFYAELEREILTRVNALGIGPGGLGGATTALSCACIAAPTHIAGLPVAVNISCHVTRHAGLTI
jgi:fumarate hydratase subunit alpha